jgi:hypothetical protein
VDRSIVRVVFADFCQYAIENVGRRSGVSTWLVGFSKVGYSLVVNPIRTLLFKCSTHTRSLTPTHMRTHTLTLTHSLTHIHAITHSLTHSLTYMQSLTHSLTYMQSLTHALAHSRTQFTSLSLFSLSSLSIYIYIYISLSDADGRKNSAELRREIRTRSRITSWREIARPSSRFESHKSQ